MIVSPSSPALASASAGRWPRSWPVREPRSSSTTSASLDGREPSDVEDRPPRIVKEIESKGRTATISHDSVSDFEAAGRIVATAVDTSVGSTSWSTTPASSEPVAPQDGRVRLRHGGRRPPKGHLQRHPARCPTDKEAGYGRIINMTSSAGLRGNFGQTNYGAAKAAIMGMTFVWPSSWASTDHGQRHGPIGRHPDDQGPASRERPRPARTPPSTHALVAFLASEQASFVNGQVLGRTGYAYTLFQTPRQIAAMWQEGGGRRPRWPTISTRSSASISSPSACRATPSSASANEDRSRGLTEVAAVDRKPPKFGVDIATAISRLRMGVPASRRPCPGRPGSPRPTCGAAARPSRSWFLGSCPPNSGADGR